MASDKMNSIFNKLANSKDALYYGETYGLQKTCTLTKLQTAEPQKFEVKFV